MLVNDERSAERHSMVEHQLRRRGIRDERVLQAMQTVPRHCFVPEHLRHAAYEDCPLPIGEGQTISQPYMVAHACELAEIERDDRVLDVGSGSGYQAAILAQLSERVIGIELIATLAERSRNVLRMLGYASVEIVTGDGTLGYAAHAPYDAILVAASAPRVPKALIEQLADGGRLVMPVGPDFMQILTVLRKTPNGIARYGYEGCAFVPLRSGESVDLP
jgi:protein-L-isoaspartate(D-aspartate) O-methyltransferase